MKTIIMRPIVTEKSTQASKLGVYEFVVAKSSDKIEIAREIERLYGVKVDNVRSAIMHGKARRTGKKRIEVAGADWKKAFVTLKKGEKITAFDIQ